MRILHVLDHSLPLHSGYTFRTRAIVKAQKATGLEVACLTGPRHGAGGPDPETIEGIDFYRTPRPAPAPSPLREWREIAGAGRRGSTGWSTTGGPTSSTPIRRCSTRSRRCRVGAAAAACR